MCCCTQFTHLQFTFIWAVTYKNIREGLKNAPKCKLKKGNVIIAKRHTRKAWKHHNGMHDMLFWARPHRLCVCVCVCAHMHKASLQGSLFSPDEGPDVIRLWYNVKIMADILPFNLTVILEPKQSECEAQTSKTCFPLFVCPCEGWKMIKKICFFVGKVFDFNHSRQSWVMDTSLIPSVWKKGNRQGKEGLRYL